MRISIWEMIIDMGYLVTLPKLTPDRPQDVRAWYQLLPLQYDEPLSNFVSNFNLRRYNKALYRRLFAPGSKGKAPAA